MVNFMLQMNGKEFKATRETLALWHIADFVLADELLQKNKRVNALSSLINSNVELIKKLENGCTTVMKSKEELESEIQTYESKIQSENEAMAKIREEQKVALDKARDLVTDELVVSITNYMSDIYSDLAEQSLLNVLVKWFKDNGAQNVDADGVKPYIRALGVKKASAKQKCTTNKHNAVQTKSTVVDIFLGAICDEPTLNKLLPIHKWQTVIEKKVNNK